MHDFGSIDGTGWKASIKKEIDRVVGFKAMEVISERKMRRDIDRCGYPERASIGNFVLAFRIKTDPDGGLLDPSKCRKSRLTFADSKSSRNAQAALNFYSACVSSSSSRLISQIAVEFGAFQHTYD
jgi:hypothetical protein